VDSHFLFVIEIEKTLLNVIDIFIYQNTYLNILIRIYIKFLLSKQDEMAAVVANNSIGILSNGGVSYNELVYANVE